MNHFSSIPTPSGRPHSGHGDAPALALAAALTCGLTLAVPSACGAGTVIRGEVRLPQTAAGVDANGKKTREPLDRRDAVVYVTTAPGGDGRALSGRAGRRDIEIEDGRLGPRVLPVVVGSRVRFRNRDRVYHRLFSVSPAGRVEIGELAPGRDREHRFDRTGVINLFCEIHPAMAGFVVVCPNWFFARPDASGAYVLPPLPRGSYLVHAWHPRRGVTRRPVEVTGRGILAVNLSY